MQCTGLWAATQITSAKWQIRLVSERAFARTGAVRRGGAIGRARRRRTHSVSATSHWLTRGTIAGEAIVAAAHIDGRH